MICSMNAPGTCIFVDIDFPPHHHHQHTCAPGRAVFLRQGLPQIVWVYFQYRQPAGRPGCTATFMSRGRDKIRPVGATRRIAPHPSPGREWPVAQMLYIAHVFATPPGRQARFQAQDEPGRMTNTGDRMLPDFGNVNHLLTLSELVIRTIQEA